MRSMRPSARTNCRWQTMQARNQNHAPERCLPPKLHAAHLPYRNGRQSSTDVETNVQQPRAAQPRLPAYSLLSTFLVKVCYNAVPPQVCCAPVCSTPINVSRNASRKACIPQRRRTTGLNTSDRVLQDSTTRGSDRSRGAVRRRARVMPLQDRYCVGSTGGRYGWWFHWPVYCEPNKSALEGFRSLPYPDAQSGDAPDAAAGVPPALVTVIASDGGESDMVRELKMPLISRRSSDTWSFGAVVLSLMKSLIDRMMGGHASSLGSHQSDGPTPMDSSMRLRSTSE